jgi:hypothetical protein
MSTRSFIAKQIGEDKYRTIYCHSDGYLTYNGAMLLDHYNTPEMVDKLLDLGDVSYIAEKLEPDPSMPHGFDYNQRQDGVTVAYGRDRGETNVEARDMTLAELDDSNNWTEYVYIFNQDNEWKYFKRNCSAEGLRSVKDDLAEEYAQYGIERPEGFYGFLTNDFIEQVKYEQSLTDEDNSIEMNM